MVTVEDGVVVAGGVPTVVIVNIAVAVVVDAVVRNFSFVDPVVGREVGVVEVGPFDDGHHDVVVLGGLSAGGDVPRFGGAHVSAGRSSGLSGVAVVPLCVEFRVVRDGLAQGDRVVELHRLYAIGQENGAEERIFIKCRVVKPDEVDASAF